MFNKKHPIWKIIHNAVLIGGVIWGLSTGYREGWVQRTDFPILLKIVGPFFAAGGAGYVFKKLYDDEGEDS